MTNRTVCWTAVLVFLCGASAWAADDDFNDNAIAPSWSTVIDAPGVLDVVEQNQRLETIATTVGVSTNDALYLSNGPAGFRLSTDADFEIAIDYSFTGFTSIGVTGDSLALALGVGRDLDGTDSAAIAFGYFNTGFGTVSALGAAYRTDDTQDTQALGFGAATGTFVIAYDALGDDLTLALEGDASYVLQDTVRGVWNADDLLVSFGARGSGYAVSSGQAWLDSFVIRSGQIVPEPATLTLAGLSLLLLARRRHRRR